MNRRQFLTEGLGVLSLAFAGCTRPDGPEDRMELRLSYLQPSLLRGRNPTGVFSPGAVAVAVGIEAKLFERAGFAVSPQALRRTPDAIPLLVQGGLDATGGGLYPGFLNAVGRGGKVRISMAIAPEGSECGPAGTLYGRRDEFPEGLDDVRLLRGKKVAVEGIPSVTLYQLDLHLEHAGMSRDDVEIVVGSRTTRIAALLSGEISATPLTHTLDFQPQDREKLTRGRSLAEAAPDVQLGFLFLGKRLVEHPDVADRFLTAYREALKMHLGGRWPHEAEGWLTEISDDWREMIRICHGAIPASGQVNLQGLRRYIDWARRYGYFAGDLEAEDLIHSSALTV